MPRAKRICARSGCPKHCNRCPDDAEELAKTIPLKIYDAEKRQKWWQPRSFRRSAAPTITLEGWRSFVDSEPLDMTPLPTSDLETLTPARHELYDEQRISYHSELVIIQTSTARSIIHQGQLLTMLNQREVSARRGRVVSGPWASGKTTAIKQLGKTHELRIRRRYPG